MSNYSSLIATINANVKTNGNEEITGSIMNSVLNSIVSSLGTGYLFKGIANTSTNPGTPDEKVFYLGGAGTYSYFGSPTIQPGNLGVFWYDSSWHSQAIDVAPVIDIVNNLRDGGVDKALSAEMGKYIGGILEGSTEVITSAWGAWALSSGTPKRAFTIAVKKSVLNGVVSVKLSSYSTYKITLALQTGTSWDSPTIFDTGWQTSNIRKVIASGEEDYYIRVGIGKVNNSNITLTEFLSAITELSYTYEVASGGLVSKVGEIEDVVELGNIIPDYAITGEEEIDLSSITADNCIMASNKTWAAANVGKHKSLSVTPGEKYVIFGDGNGFWGFMSSSYYEPVTNGGSVPYATGYTNRVLQKGAVAVTIPSGVAYLVFTTINGSGVSSTWRIWKVSSYKRKTTLISKIRMAHWNIGGFVYTDWQPGQSTHVIPSADAAAYAQKYRELIDSVNPDILGIAEYDPSFSAAGQTTKNVIFQCFRSQHEGHKSGANCNSLFGNIMDWVGVEEIDFTNRQENRYYTHLTARVNGENVHIVEAHLDHTYTAKRVAQIAQLIADMSPYDYVIIGGDFNTGDESSVVSEFAAFTNAGYTMLNSDYLGLLVTSLTEEYVDNIVVKGFTMLNRQVSQPSGTLSDHLLLSCDLTMQFDQ